MPAHAEEVRPRERRDDDDAGTHRYPVSSHDTLHHRVALRRVDRGRGAGRLRSHGVTLVSGRQVGQLWLCQSTVAVEANRLGCSNAMSPWRTYMVSVVTMLPSFQKKPPFG